MHGVELNDKEDVVMIYVDDASRHLPTIVRAMDNNIKSVNFRSPSLNDVFLKFTGRHIMAQQEDHAEGGFMERYAQYGNK